MQTTPALPTLAPSEIYADPNHALDALRAARLRRQLADEGSSIFVHSPRPAIVPDDPRYAYQRRFGSGPGLRATRVAPSDREACSMNARAVVYRDGEFDLAELSLNLGLSTRAQITERLTPDELRDLAARLIDAAHDIEAHPAADLARDAQGGAA